MKLPNGPERLEPVRWSKHTPPLNTRKSYGRPQRENSSRQIGKTTTWPPNPGVAPAPPEKSTSTRLEEQKGGSPAGTMLAAGSPENSGSLGTVLLTTGRAVTSELRRLALHVGTAAAA